MNNNKRIPSLYVCLYEKFLNASKNFQLPRREAKFIIAVSFHIPKVLKPVVLKEMEQFGLIEKHSTARIKITDPKIKLENTSEVYEKVGLY